MYAIHTRKGIKMPNIEIHGFATLTFDSPVSTKTGYQVFLDEKAYWWRNSIWKLFSDKPYRSDMVVTIVPDHVSDKNLYRQPFLRVVSTPSDHLKEIVEILKTLNIDIEVQMLSAFFPKKSAPAG